MSNDCYPSGLKRILDQEEKEEEELAYVPPPAKKLKERIADLEAEMDGRQVMLQSLKRQDRMETLQPVLDSLRGEQEKYIFQTLQLIEEGIREKKQRVMMAGRHLSFKETEWIKKQYPKTSILITRVVRDGELFEYSFSFGL